MADEQDEVDGQEEENESERTDDETQTQYGGTEDAEPSTTENDDDEA